MRAGRRLLTTAAVAGAATGGAVLGWLAERRAAADMRDGSDPEAVELARAVTGRPRQVTAADGTRLHAEILGPDDAPAIVLAHGYTMTQDAWHYQRRDLSEEFRVVSYDQRGHGASAEAETGDYTMDALASDLAAVIERCVPPGERVVVAGHSLGAMSALALAKEHGELLGPRVAGLALVSTSGADIIGGVLGGAAAVATNALPAVADALLPRLVGMPGPLGARPSDFTFLLIRAISLSPNASPAHVAFTERLSMGCPSAVRAALIPAFTSLDLTDAARGVSVPALVISGDLDRLTPPSGARQLAELLPDARLVELQGVGHMAPLEAHEAVTAHLRAFARRVLTLPDAR
ncbi:MAG TPA: alpha/beta hydrolase [Egibacteraceae bacterium]|nr:alpha/beta hydrolase [Egibacteraceae bacterium]